MNAEKCPSCNKCFFDSGQEKCPHCKKILPRGSNNPFEGTGFEDIFKDIFKNK